MPLSLGGTDNLENLALACFHCNRRKTNRLMATDLQSGEEVLLFNPRQHIWSDHFIWSCGWTINCWFDTYWTSNCHCISLKLGTGYQYSCS
ncbi:MAG: HNH endonuclease [Nostoc sp.]|uniref:HNH endonuclease n=1 Tax=Nostoc sp. TaxID=1180 RepID=UPI002FF10E4C